MQLQDGEVLEVRRDAVAEPFGQIGGTGGWENKGMALKVVSASKRPPPAPWKGKFVPLIFDHDSESQEWFIVASFYSCTSWYELGRPELPYVEFRYRSGQWQQQPLSPKFIGRRANMLADIRSSGEPNHTLASKNERMANGRLASKYTEVVSSWKTHC